MGGECSASRRCSFTSMKDPFYPFNRGLNYTALKHSHNTDAVFYSGYLSSVDIDILIYLLNCNWVATLWQ
jgi:hypothetical protein